MNGAENQRTQTCSPSLLVEPGGAMTVATLETAEEE